MLTDKTPEHPFVAVPHQTGCARCGFARGHHPTQQAYKRLLAQIDRQVETIYYRHCSGIQINVMDINKVFEAGRAAALAGGDVEAAVVAKVAEVAL